ncbi:MAG: hypothetical protein WDN31_21245 [Hyphomicrobium sp.]
MRKLVQQLEEMHMRIAETATHEEALVKALGDALSRLDEQLLADVQNIASEHEVRRTAILGELQGLASSIGMFQIPHQGARAEIESEPVGYIPSAGDWREAMSNIRDELDEQQSGAVPMPQRALFPHERRAQPSVAVSLIERRRRASGG